jgi:hypothetical protein
MFQDICDLNAISLCTANAILLCATLYESACADALVHARYCVSMRLCIYCSHQQRKACLAEKKIVKEQKEEVTFFEYRSSNNLLQNNVLLISYQLLQVPLLQDVERALRPRKHSQFTQHSSCRL